MGKHGHISLRLILSEVLFKMFRFLATALLVFVIHAEVEKIERLTYDTWYLGMNLNPADGHIMGYCTGWDDDEFIGTYAGALSKDYLNRIVWAMPAQYIAIVRHQGGEVDAVKVFRFRAGPRSLLARFQDMDPGRRIETEGGPLQESVSATAQNLDDDPIFSVGGDLAFNWRYTNNGHRIVMTGGHLSAENVDDDNTFGLGNDFACNPKTGVSLKTDALFEIGNIQDCPSPTCSGPRIMQGTDGGVYLQSGPVYGNYAIYVSRTATSFPLPGTKLDLEIEVLSKYKF